MDVVFLYIEGLDGSGKSTQVNLTDNSIAKYVNGNIDGVLVIKSTDNIKSSVDFTDKKIETIYDILNKTPEILGYSADYHYRMFMRSISYYNHIESILKYNRGNIPDKIIIIQDRSFLSSYVYQNEAINNNLTDVMIDIGNIFSNITKQISKIYNVNITFHQHMFLLDSSVDVFESRNGKPRDEYENNLNVYNNRYKNIIQNTSILNWIKDSFNNFDYTIIEKNLSIEETQKIIYQNSLKYCNKNLEM